MDLSACIARLRLGWPGRGPIEKLARGTYTFEQGIEFTNRFREEFGDPAARSVADLGAGSGESEIARRIMGTAFARLVSVEPFAPYLEKLERRRSRAALHEIFRERIENVFREIPRREIDVALLVDVLEHFDCGAAHDLLVRLESWVNVGIMIFVPLGPVPQEALDDNELQRHRSEWSAEALAGLGYKVTVCEGVHGHLDPPADAAWAVKRIQRRNPAAAG